MDILSSFGETVRFLRRQRGFSQESFADKAGLDRSYMGGVERGKRNLSLKNIEKVSMALQLSLSQLFADVERNDGGEG